MFFWNIASYSFVLAAGSASSISGSEVTISIGMGMLGRYISVISISSFGIATDFAFVLAVILKRGSLVEIVTVEFVGLCTMTFDPLGVVWIKNSCPERGGGAEL